MLKKLIVATGILALFIGVLRSEHEDSESGGEGIIMTVSGTNHHIRTFTGNIYDFDLPIEHKSFVIWYRDPDTYLGSMAYDYRRHSLYTWDENSQSILKGENFNIWMNHSDRASVVFHEGISGYASQLAVDWISHNVYWVDSGYNWLVVKPDYTNDSSIYRVLIRDNMDKPEGLAIDPLAGYLFWSDTGDSQRIERSDLTGAAKSRLRIINHGLINPISLAADHDQSRLYWSDYSRDTLESAKYDGTDRLTVRRLVHTTMASISLFQDRLCVVEEYYNALLFVNKITGKLTSMDIYDGSPLAVSIWNIKTQPPGVDNCADHGCADFCINTQSGPQCQCREGSVLNDTDGRSCLEYKGLLHHGLLWSNGTDICVTDIRVITGTRHEAFCIISNLTDAHDMVVDINRREVLFLSSGALYVQSLDESSAIELYQGVGEIGGIALDWVDGNLFWTKPDAGVVAVYNRNRDVFNIIMTGLLAPTSIVLDPHKRLLFWISGVHSFKITSANFDGSKRKVLVDSSSLTKPVKLTYDLRSSRLYLIDYGTIKSVLSDGTDYQLFQPTTSGTAILIQVYQDYVIWTIDNDDDTDIFIAKGSDGRLQRIFGYPQIGKFVAMFVFDEVLQPMEKDPCRESNGGCQHICLPKENSRTCICDFGYQLETNGRSCTTNPVDNHFILATDITHHKMYQIQLEHETIQSVNVPDIHSPEAVAFDWKQNRVLWGNAETRQIKRAGLAGENETVLYSTGKFYVGRLAIDFSTGNVYYSAVHTEIGYISYIATMKSDGTAHKTIVSKLDYPRAIALYPSKGIFFWTDHGSDAHIGKGNMDGSAEMNLVVTDIGYPNGLAIDYEANKLYWTDGYYDRIEYSDLSGTGRGVLLTDESSVMMDIEISGQYLYYTALNRHYITKVDKDTGGEKTKFAEYAELGRIMDMVIVGGRTSQPVSQSCSDRNGKCSTLCLPTPSSWVCACGDEIELKADGRTCQNVQQCPENIRNGYLSSSCLRYPEESCTLTCDKGYRPLKDSSSIFCYVNGSWNTDIDTVCEAKPPTRPDQTATQIGVGVGVGACVLIIIILLIIVFVLWSRRKRRQPPAYDQQPVVYNTSSSHVESAYDNVMVANPSYSQDRQPPRYVEETKKEPSGLVVTSPGGDNWPLGMATPNPYSSLPL